LFSDLLEQSYAPKESLYWIALTFCGLGEYRASRSYCERLLRMEPSHMKAQLLHKRIKEVVAKGLLRSRQWWWSEADEIVMLGRGRRGRGGHRRSCGRRRPGAQVFAQEINRGCRPVN